MTLRFSSARQIATYSILGALLAPAGATSLPAFGGPLRFGPFHSGPHAEAAETAPAGDPTAGERPILPGGWIRRDPPTSGFRGLWRWSQEPLVEYSILYAYAEAARADSLYRAGSFDPGAPADTARYSYFRPAHWRLARAREATRVDEEVDPRTGIVSRSYIVGNRPMGAAMVYTPDAYARSTLQAGYRAQWVGAGRRLIGQAADRTRAQGLLNLSLPAMPAALQGIFGSGESTLSVSGTETIRLSGTSTWFPFQQTNALSGQSRFPDLDMKQDLVLKLSGTIGDKVHVDVDQNSNAETSLENRIRIWYEGYEDDVVRRVNLGNTNLSLPGTRFVSYGGRHEGLFGISAEGQLGPVQITTIASKQESEATTQSVPSRNSSATPIQNVRARDYVRRTYFFLDDPNRVRVVRATNQSTGETFTGNAVVPLGIQSASVRLFKDDRDGGNNNEQQAFRARVTPSGYPPCACADAPARCDDTFATLEEYPTYSLYELVQDVDFVVHEPRERFEFDGLVVEMLQPIGDREVLAVAFETRGATPIFADADGDGVFPDTIGNVEGSGGFCGFQSYRLVAPPLDLLRTEDLAVGPWATANALEVRNVYRLGGRNIDRLDLEIFWDRTGGQTQSTNYRNEPYLEIVGLDVERLSGSTSIPGQDGAVDEGYLDRDQGILHFPQLRPFAPDSFDVTYRRNPFGFENVVVEGWPLNVTLTGTQPDSGDFPEPEIYDTRATVFRLPSDTHVDRYEMRGEFQSPISVIELNRFNILDGSEEVTVGSRRLARGRDYDIDYEFGTVTIRETANVAPDDDINVTFAYAPLFGTASRSLAGFSSAIRPEGAPYGLSTTWMFESKGTSERRVKLGEEPTRTIIGEVSGDYKSESSFLTDVLDRLPFYTPAARSQISAAGAIGVSLPNPNTKGEAYIDDFDGSRDARELSLSQNAWKYPAIPQLLIEQGLSREEAAARRGNMVWYAPRRAALRGDLNPDLSAEERDDAVRVLEWWLRPNSETTGSVPITDEENWYGLTQSISSNGEDISTAQFLDIWINDFNDPDVRDGGVLYVDVGDVSEDAVWWRTGPGGYTPPEGTGLGFFDTEDRNGDNRLDESAARDTTNEDSGLDRVFDGNGDVDPNFDDWRFPSERQDDENIPQENLERFEFVNGTELNSSLDTEDLNGDAEPNTTNNYFTYRFELSTTDTNLVITDVREDFGVEMTIDGQNPNGWRQIRIPLGEDFEFDRVNLPDYTLVKHVRLWMTGVRREKPVQIALVEFTGNRWLTGGTEAPILNERDEPATDAELANGQKFGVSVINNKDNVGGLYEEAFDVPQDRTQAGKEFEGYLSLDLLNFPAGHTGTCYRRFPQDQDYTLYESIEFFTQLGVPRSGPLTLEFFIRVGSSEGSNYYEYRQPVKTGVWEMIRLPLAELSSLKLNLPPEQQVVKVPREDGSVLLMKGRPSFSRVRQITLGVKNSSGAFLSRASVWVNELRLDEVRRNPSAASVFQLSTILSDLATVTFDWSGRQADFQQIGQSRGTGINDRKLSYSTNVNMDRFAPRLNARLPVRYTYSKSTSEPRFQTGSDIVFQGANRELNVSQSVSKSVRVDYSRTPSTNPFLRYTLDAVRAGFSWNQRNLQRPASSDSTTNWNANVSYNFTTPRHRLLQLPLGLAIDYLPSNLSAQGATTRSEAVTWQRPSSDLTRPLELQNVSRNKTASFSWNTAYRMLQKPNVNYQFSQTRDLLVKGTDVAGVNLGSESNRTESLSASYSLAPIDGASLKGYPLGGSVAGVLNRFVVPLRPSVNWSGRFSASIDVSRAGEVSALRPQRVQNSANTTVRGAFPLNRVISGLKRAVESAAAAMPTPGGGDDEGDGEESGGERASEGEETGKRDPRRGRGRGTRRTPPSEDGRGEDRPVEGDAGSEEPAPAKSTRSPFSLGITFNEVNGQYTRTRSSSHSLIDGMPSFGYRLGFTRELDRDIQRLVNNSSGRTDSDVYTISSGFRMRSMRFGSIKLGSVIDVKSSFTTESTGRVTTTITGDGSIGAPVRQLSDRRTWPDLQMNWTNVEDGVPFLKNRFRRLTLSSRYSKSRNVQGDQTRPRRSVTVSSDWTPFLSIETTLKSGMRISLRSNRSSSEQQLNQAVRGIGTNARSDISLNVQHTMERKRTVDLPFGKGKRQITTRIDLALTISRQRTRQGTSSEATGFREVLSSDVREFNTSVQAGYNFTRNVSGTANVRYGERRDFKTLSRTRRTLGLTVSATFQF